MNLVSTENQKHYNLVDATNSTLSQKSSTQAAIYLFISSLKFHDNLLPSLDYICKEWIFSVYSSKNYVTNLHSKQILWVAVILYICLEYNPSISFQCILWLAKIQDTVM
jgi:hypothetical protein